MNREINLVYTDGSHPYNTKSTKDTLYYGYHLIDSNEKEFTYTSNITQTKYNEYFKNNDKVNSTIAELLAIHTFLFQLNESDRRTILQEYQIFTDSEHCFNLLNRNTKIRKYKSSNNLQLEIIRLLKELRLKDCIIEIMWVESHKENWGNLFIDIEINKYRGSKIINSIEKKKEFRLKQILFEDYLLNRHGLEYSDFLNKLLSRKNYTYKNKKYSSNNFAFNLIQAFSYDRKLVFDFMKEYF